MVNAFKGEKDQFDYKLQQYENVIKCQKLEIDSKTSLIKQFDLKIQDMTNELNSLKALNKTEFR
jgi:hypothetical protein